MALLTVFSAAVLMQATPAAPDLSWLAGYWLDCSGGREASETWSDPRAGLLVGHTVTVRNGRSGFEFARIAPLPDGVWPMSPSQAGPRRPPSAWSKAGRSARFSPTPPTTFPIASSISARGMC